MKNIFVNQDYLYDPSRKLFYSDKNSLYDLDKDATEICSKNQVDLPSLIIDKLKLCLLVYPEYEVWTPLSLIKNNEENVRVISFSHSVSTLGRVYSHVKDTELLITFDEVSGYYKCTANGKSYLIQRAVLSSFGYDQRHVSMLPLSLLTVNHIDHVRSNNELTNLEWMTSQENIADMHNHIGKDHPKFPKPVQVVLVKDINGLPKGNIYYLENRSLLCSYGLNNGSVRNAITKGFALRGCLFSDISAEDAGSLKFGIPEELKNHFNRIPVIN